MAGVDVEGIGTAGGRMIDPSGEAAEVDGIVGTFRDFPLIVSLCDCGGGLGVFDAEFGELLEGQLFQNDFTAIEGGDAFLRAGSL
jgi:hypothetical protein